MSGAAYREHVASALAGGAVFGGLHASLGGGAVRVLLIAPDGSCSLESIEAKGETPSVPSIVDLAHGAQWDEREAADLYKLAFDGHDPLRPLIDHSGPLSRWTVPVRGHDVHQVAVGPIHAGVIESGQFRFHVVGDRILLLDLRLGYKHRGLERAAEGLTPRRGVSPSSRAPVVRVG